MDGAQLKHATAFISLIESWDCPPILSSGGRAMVVKSEGSIICIIREYFWERRMRKVGSNLRRYGSSCWSQSTLLQFSGPFLWAEVGEILNVVFKNNASRPYSIHAHGVLERQTGQPQVAHPGKSQCSPALILLKVRKSILAYS